MKRLRGLQSIFSQLWKHFETVAEAVLQKEGVVVIEWPTSCRYWKDPRVQRFLHENGFDKAQIHGCAYRLAAPCGAPVKKPWALASNDAAILEKDDEDMPRHGGTPQAHSMQGQRL